MIVAKEKPIQVYLEARHLVFLNQLTQELGIQSLDKAWRGRVVRVSHLRTPKFDRDKRGRHVPFEHIDWT